MDMPVALVSRERSRSASSSIRIVRIPIFLPPWIQARICITIHITRPLCCQVRDDAWLPALMAFCEPILLAFYFFPPINPPSSAPSEERSVWIVSGSGIGIFRKDRPLTSSRSSIGIDVGFQQIFKNRTPRAFAELLPNDLFPLPRLLMLGHPGQDLVMTPQFVTVGLGSILKQPGQVQQVFVPKSPLTIK